MPETPNFKPELNKSPEIKSEPTFELDIFYAFHGTAEDFAQLDKYFERADVVVPEIVWDTANLSYYAALAEGSVLPDNNDTASAYYERLLYNSKKPVMVVDVPKGHEAHSKFEEGEIRFADSFKQFSNGEYDAALNTYESALKQNLQGVKIEREAHMIERLRIMIPQLTSKFPKLKNKQHIRILMTIGATHTGLTHELNRSPIPNVKTNMILGESPIVYNYNEELSRAIEFGQPIKVGLLEKAVIGAYIDSNLKKVIQNNNELRKTVRLLGDVISTEEIRQFSYSLGRLQKGKDQDEYTTSKILEWLDRAKSQTE